MSETHPCDRQPAEQLLRDEAVGKKAQVSRRQVWILSARGVLPPPRRIGKLARWIQSEVDEALRALPRAEREGGRDASAP